MENGICVPQYPPNVTCGNGTVLYDGQCVTRYYPDWCTPTEDPAEVCDGVDNDCDSIIDNGCAAPNEWDLLTFPGADPGVQAYACIDDVVGKYMVATSDGSVYYLDFHMNTPSILHRVLPNGEEATTVDLFDHIKGLYRSHDGLIYVTGARGGSPTWTRVDRFDPADPTTINTIFSSSEFMAQYTFNVDDQGRTYFSKWDKGAGGYLTFRTTGEDSTSYETVFGTAPSGYAVVLAFSPLDGMAFLRDQVQFGKIAADGSYTSLDQPDTGIGKLVTGPDGELYALVFNKPWNSCINSFSMCDNAVRRFDADGTNGQIVLHLEDRLNGIAIDPESGDLITAVWLGEEGGYGCPSGTGTALIRYSTEDLAPVADVPPIDPGNVFAQTQGAEPVCVEDAQLIGVPPDVECVVDPPPPVISCGEGTVLSGTTCVLASPVVICGEGTSQSGGQCIADCPPQVVCMAGTEPTCGYDYECQQTPGAYRACKPACDVGISLGQQCVGYIPFCDKVREQCLQWCESELQPYGSDIGANSNPDDIPEWCDPCFTGACQVMNFESVGGVATASGNMACSQACNTAHEACKDLFYPPYDDLP